MRRLKSALVGIGLLAILSLIPIVVTMVSRGPDAEGRSSLLGYTEQGLTSTRGADKQLASPTSSSESSESTEPSPSSTESCSCSSDGEVSVSSGLGGGAGGGEVILRSKRCLVVHRSNCRMKTRGSQVLTIDVDRRWSGVYFINCVAAIYWPWTTAEPV